MGEYTQKECPKHGLTIHRKRKDSGTWGCKICAQDAVIVRRKKIKLMAIEYKGGKCEICGRTFAPPVYDFHHLDPTKKDFGIARQGISRSWERVKAELDKCQMLCANCHRVVKYTGE